MHPSKELWRPLQVAFPIGCQFDDGCVTRLQQSYSLSGWANRRSSTNDFVERDVGAESERSNVGARMISSRRVVASYGTYEEAQRAVDDLADERFPIARLSIVGEGVHFIEDVTGRVGYGKAILSAAGSGALPGAFFGFIFGLLDWVTPLISGLTLAFYGVVFGAILGALFGLATHVFSRGRRDFSSVSRLQASRYDVVVDEEIADEAGEALRKLDRSKAKP